MKTIEEFKLLCASRNIPFTATANSWHFKVVIEGHVYNFWPTKDKFAREGATAFIGAEEFLQEKFPEITSYLSHYLKQNPDNSWSYILWDCSLSEGYPTHDECLFEFGKYSSRLEQRGFTS